MLKYATKGCWNNGFVASVMREWSNLIGHMYFACARDMPREIYLLPNRMYSALPNCSLLIDYQTQVKITALAYTPWKDGIETDRHKR